MTREKSGKTEPGLTLNNLIFGYGRGVPVAFGMPRPELIGNWIHTADRIAGYAHRTPKAFGDLEIRLDRQP